MTRIISSLFVTLIALGCASTEARPDRISTNVGEVEGEASAYAYFASARVQSANGVTNIRGRIGSRTGGRLIRPGHISLTIRDADGELLHTEEIRYMLQRRPRRPPRSATFYALAPVEVPPGGRVRLEHHWGPREGSGHELRE